MNCPFCHKQLVKDLDGYYTCYTDNCAVMSAGGNGASGTLSLWLKVIQMHLALKEIIGDNYEQKGVEHGTSKNTNNSRCN